MEQFLHRVSSNWWSIASLSDIRGREHTWFVFFFFFFVSIQTVTLKWNELDRLRFRQTNAFSQEIGNAKTKKDGKKERNILGKLKEEKAMKREKKGLMERTKDRCYFKGKDDWK